MVIEVTFSALENNALDKGSFHTGMNHNMGTSTLSI